MDQLRTVKADWDELQGLTTAYFTELGYKNDGFHNEKIFEGEAYEILQGEESIGFLSLGDSWKKEKMFRTFYIIPERRGNSEEIFQRLAEEYQCKAILVASNDAHLVSLAFEHMHKCEGNFDMQAYNFVYGEASRPAEYGMEHLVRLTPSEYEEVERVSEGLWDGCFEDSGFEFYALKDGEEVLGYGAIAKMEYNQRNVDLGNFAMPEHRRKGVGRSIIINLSRVAMTRGQVPVAGCWYGNKKSLSTLKSSGFIPENRIFYIRF